MRRSFFIIGKSLAILCHEEGIGLGGGELASETNLMDVEGWELEASIPLLGWMEVALRALSAMSAVDVEHSTPHAACSPRYYYPKGPRSGIVSWTWKTTMSTPAAQTTPAGGMISDSLIAGSFCSRWNRDGCQTKSWSHGSRAHPEIQKM